MASDVYLLHDLTQLDKVLSFFTNKYFDKALKVIIKMHFGEPLNQASFLPKDIIPFVNYFKTNNFDTVLFDTPVIYPSPRNNVTSYLSLIKEKGYEKISNLKIEENYVKIKMKHFDSKVAQTLIDNNSLVLSHFKGHKCSGFGGAIKNLAMGGVSKETKIVQHSLGAPVLVKNCIGCGTCQKYCPRNSIKIIEGKAIIDYTSCVGCSICVYKCVYGCLKPKKITFDELLGEAAASLINNMKNVIYINSLNKISKYCDCSSDHGGFIAKDYGYMISENPIAIDKAGLDYVIKNEGKNVFEIVNHKDPYLQIEYAKKYTGLSDEYDLIDYN